MNNFKRPGEVIDYVAAAAGTSGSVVVIGTRIAVLMKDCAIGDTVSARVRGVFTLPKKSTDTFVQGAAVYWDATNLYCTSTTTSNTLAGYAFAAFGSGAAAMDVSINA